MKAKNMNWYQSPRWLRLTLIFGPCLLILQHGAWGFYSFIEARPVDVWYIISFTLGLLGVTVSLSVSNWVARSRMIELSNNLAEMRNISQNNELK